MTTVAVNETVGSAELEAGESERETAISIRNLFKVFGDDDQIEAALAMSADGKNKAEVQEETGAVIGINDVSLEIGKGEMFVVMGLGCCT